MIYGSVCSGIEAATVAWKSLGWKAAWFSEIEPFPSAVLEHHYPDVQNLGDMTRIYENEKFKRTVIDLLVGGTPCQSFSVAGFRKGMEDPRGNLALVYLSIVDRTRPKWVVWENVPGALSSVSHDAPDPCPPPDPMDVELDGQEVDTNDDYHSEEVHALNCFLATLSELGYGWAYRVLDAQYCGVPQRRRRIFVIGYLGDWRRATSVLFERESLSRYSPPSREEGKGLAPTVTGGPPFSRTGNERVEAEAMVAHMRGFGDYEIDDKASALKSRDHKDATDLITVAVRTAQTSANGCGVSEDVAHTLDGALGQAVAFQSKASSTNSMNPSEITPTLDKGKGDGVVVASFKAGQGAKAGSIGYEEEVAPTLGAADSGSNRTPALMSGMTVRRLTPRECERLQGFPDNYTRIPRNHKKAADCPDGPRYKALGNSMAVPVMQWIGQRIQEVENGQ